jgi:hypothetical protein
MIDGFPAILLLKQGSSFGVWVVKPLALKMLRRKRLAILGLLPRMILKHME